MGIELKRGPGRPKGSKNNPIRFRNWQLKKWTVDHEMILLMHVSGKTNKAIAESLDKTEAHVGNVLACKIGQEKLGEIKNRLRDGVVGNIEQKLAAIMEKSVDRVYEFIHNDKQALLTPVAMVDRSMKAMEMIDARLRSNGSGSNNTLVLATEETLGKLTEAMNMANRAREINAGKYAVSTITSNEGIRVNSATG